MVVSCSLERALRQAASRPSGGARRPGEQQIILLRKLALGRKKTIWLRTFTDDLCSDLFHAFALNTVRVPE
jgi:hypothetical protein